jgi:hypothetical protein
VRTPSQNVSWGPSVESAWTAFSSSAAAHLEEVLAEYLVHYNGHRPHRALDQQAPLSFGATPTPVRDPDAIGLRRTEILGGLIHEYRLVA